MTEYREIYVAPCVSLHAELSRQPWLSEEERIAEAVDVAVERAVEDAAEGLYTAEEYASAKEDASDEGKRAAYGEVERILEEFDVDDDNYAVKVVDSLNAWLKENL